MERDPHLTFQRQEREKIDDDIHTYTQKVLQIPVQHNGFTVVHKEERQHSILTPAASLAAAPITDVQIVAQEVAVRYEGLIVHLEWCTSYQQESNQGRIPPVNHTWRNHMTMDFAHLLGTGQGNPVERINALHRVPLIQVQQPSHPPAARVSWSSSAVVDPTQTAQGSVYVMPSPIKVEPGEAQPLQHDPPPRRQQHLHPSSRPPLRIPGNPPPVRPFDAGQQVAHPPRSRPQPRDNTSIHPTIEDIISIASDSDDESVLGSVRGSGGRGNGVGGGSTTRGGGRGVVANGEDDGEDLDEALKDVKAHYYALKRQRSQQQQQQRQRSSVSGSGLGKAGPRGSF